MKRNHAKVHFPWNRISFKSVGRCCGTPRARVRNYKVFHQKWSDKSIIPNSLFFAKLISFYWKETLWLDSNLGRKLLTQPIHSWHESVLIKPVEFHLCCLRLQFYGWNCGMEIPWKCKIVLNFCLQGHL